MCETEAEIIEEFSEDGPEEIAIQQSVLKAIANMPSQYPKSAETYQPPTPAEQQEIIDKIREEMKRLRQNADKLLFGYS